MPTLSPQARAIVAAFGRQPGVTQDHLNNLQAAIHASPVLIERINAAEAQPSAWQAQRGHVPVPDDAARCRPGVRM